MSEPVRAQPGPQTELLQCPVSDVFWGGARGGGKSFALLLDWAQHANAYGAAAKGIVFRHNYPQLEELIGISRRLFSPLGWTFNENRKEWTAPNGALLRFRFLEVEQDAENLQGFSVTWQGWDELTNWPTSKGIDRLYATLRSAEGVPCVRRSTGNPGGPGHAWVHKRYVKGRKPRQPFWMTPNADRPDLKVEAMFIPSRLEDNQLLVKNDPGYEARLAASGDTSLFKAWRYGDWDVLSGQYFECWDARKHTKRLDLIEDWWPKFLAIDWGFTHDTAVLWCAQDEDGNYLVYRELVINKTPAPELGEQIADLTGDEHIESVYLSPDAFGAKQSARTIADELNDVLDKRGLPRAHRASAGTDSGRQRVSGWMLLYQLLAHQKLTIDSSCRRLIETIPMLVRDGDHPEDVLKVDGDDTADCLRYLICSRIRQPNVPFDLQVKRAIDATRAVDATDRMRVGKMAIYKLNRAEQGSPLTRRGWRVAN